MVFGLSAVNSASFVIGAVLGQVLLRRRLGAFRAGPVLATIGRTLLASLAGGIAAYAVVGLLATGPVGDWPSASRAWAVLLVAAAVFVPTTLLAMRVVRVRELDPVWRRLRKRGPRKPSQNSGTVR